MPVLTLFDDVLPDERPTRETTSLGPDASAGENISAFFTQGQLTESSASASEALQAARAERRAAIEKATGKPFGEAIAPYMPKAPEQDGPPTDGGGDPWASFQRPDSDVGSGEDLAADALVQGLRGAGTGSDVLTSAQLKQRARELALDSITSASDIEARSPGFNAGVARFVGGGGAAMTDPLMLMMLPFGAAAETGVLGTAAIEGMLGGVGTALTLPGVAAWRKELGLPEHSAAEDLQQVGEGALLAGATGGLLKGAGRLLTVTPRQAVEAFDRAFPDGDAPAALKVNRDVLESVANLADDNPLGDTPAGESAHVRRTIEADTALADDAAPIYRARYPDPVAAETRAPEAPASVAPEVKGKVLDDAPEPNAAHPADEGIPATDPTLDAPQAAPRLVVPRAAELSHARSQADLVAEPGDIASLKTHSAELEGELRARRAEAGAEMDLHARAISDGQFEKADDLLDDLDRDREFIDAVKLCLT